MVLNSPGVIFHSNKYCEAGACEHCFGVVRHEPWCITRNSLVYYAYEVVLDADKLSLADRPILHALGAAWMRPECAGDCATR